MTTRPMDPTEPLAELDANIVTTGAGSAGMPEDDEAQWKRWCATQDSLASKSHHATRACEVRTCDWPVPTSPERKTKNGRR